MRHAQQAVDFRHRGAVFGRRGRGVHAGVVPACVQRRGGNHGLHGVGVVLQGVVHGLAGRLQKGGLLGGAVVQGAQGGGEQVGRFQADDDAAVRVAVVAGGEVGNQRGTVEINGEVEVAFAARGDAGDFLHGGGAAGDLRVVGNAVCVGGDIDAGVGEVAEVADEFGQ